MSARKASTSARVGGKPGQVETQAADQRGAVGLGRRPQALGLEPGEDEVVDRTPGPGGVADDRHGRPDRRDERPVRPVGRPLLDPAPEEVFLGRAQSLAALGRRHEEPLAGRADPPIETALGRLARDDRRPSRLGRLEHRLVAIEPELGLALVLVGSVTLETTVRQDRPDLAVEVDLRGRQAPAAASPQGRRRGTSSDRAPHTSATIDLCPSEKPFRRQDRPAPLSLRVSRSTQGGDHLTTRDEGLEDRVQQVRDLGELGQHETEERK